MARKRGRVRQAIANRLSTFKTNRATRRAAKAARRAARPIQPVQQPRTIVQVVRAAPQRVKRVASRGAAMAGSAISRLRAGVGNTRAGRRNASSGVDIKSAGKSFLMAGAGGVGSALLTGILTLDESDPKAQFNDDNPFVQLALKGGIGLAAQWLFGKGRNVQDLVAGWNGHAAGYAIAGYTDKAFQLAKTAKDVDKVLNPKK